MLEDRDCLRCGEAFIPQRTNQKFCSPEHRNQYNERKSRLKARASEGTWIDQRIRQLQYGVEAWAEYAKTHELTQGEVRSREVVVGMLARFQEQQRSLEEARDRWVQEAEQPRKPTVFRATDRLETGLYPWRCGYVTGPDDAACGQMLTANELRGRTVDSPHQQELNPFRCWNHLSGQQKGEAYDNIDAVREIEERGEAAGRLLAET